MKDSNDEKSLKTSIFSKVESNQQSILRYKQNSKNTFSHLTLSEKDLSELKLQLERRKSASLRLPPINSNLVDPNFPRNGK